MDDGVLVCDCYEYPVVSVFLGSRLSLMLVEIHVAFCNLELPAFWVESCTM